LRDHAHPAGWRSAVSRAFYAAHHVVREFVEGAGVRVVRGAAAHADVWSHLVDTHDVEVEKVGSQLAELHSDRNAADYQLAKSDMQNEKTAAAEVARVRNLIDIIRPSRSDSMRYEQLKKVIQACHRILQGLPGS
jgi:uncharacterized protein (UPF0332 family)